MTGKEDKEAFLSRWSRLKREAGNLPPQKGPAQPADSKSPPPDLPPVEKLTFDSDYRAFFHPKVEEDVRRTALKKLFSDPRFNVMDGLDVYIDDYSKADPIPPAMLAGLKQAQRILEWAKGNDENGKQEREPAAEPRTGALEDHGAAPAAPAPPAGPSSEEPAVSRDLLQPRGPAA